MNPILFIKSLLEMKKILIYWLITGVVIAVIAALIQPPIYICGAKWLIKRETSSDLIAGLLNPTTLLLSAKTSLIENAINANILQSPDIIKEIISKANLKNKYGEPITIEEFRKNFQVKPNKRFPYLTVKYQSIDPKEAYNVLVIAEEVYRTKSITAEAKKAQSDRIFMEREVSIAEKDFQIAAKDLSLYEKSANIVNIEAEIKQQQYRTAELQKDLANAKAKLASVQDNIKNLTSKLGIKSSYEALEKTIIGNDQTIMFLKDKLLQKKQELITLKQSIPINTML